MIHRTNYRFRGKKACQPIVEPLFSLIPFLSLQGGVRLIETSKALDEVGTSRALRRVRSNGVTLGIAHVPFHHCTERFGIGTPVWPFLLPQHWHHGLQEIVFVPAAHFDSENAPSILFQSMRRPFWRWDFTASAEKPVRAAVSS
jgi:hypothetical protein